MTAGQLNDEDLANLSQMILNAQIPTKLFHYTEEEEKRMQNAIRASIRFMAKFGQAPKQPLIDTTHYCNEKQTKWYEQRN